MKKLGRTSAPITRAGVAQLAGVSRSFTYENDQARATITEAQARTQAPGQRSRQDHDGAARGSWRERALNAEDQIRTLHSELTTQRRLVADLMGQLRQPDGTGQLRQPDGTWVQDDRDRLRTANEHLTTERDHLAKDRNELQRSDGARANIAHINNQ